LNDALTGPVLAAAALVCVAAVGKLREPGGAVRALSALGLPAGVWWVRALCGLELAAGACGLVVPGPPSVAVLAGVYGTFGGGGAALRRRGAECGCFGETGDETDGETGGEAGAPPSVAHVLLSGALALMCAAGVVWPPHRVGWALARPVLALGIAGCVYAIVLAYTQLPVAWGAWRAR
jgi:hypothetical protein